MSKSKIDIGFIQFNPVLGRQDKNIKQLNILLNKIPQADLVVIPELANSGYNFENNEQAYSLAEDLSNSVYLNFISEEAKKRKMFIVSGINEKEDGKLYNSSILVGPKGLVGKYRKIHLFWNEFDIFEKGNLGLPVFDLGFASVGMLICFDWVFPEVWRILALKGADIICHPSNLVLPYAQQAVPVHGMINKTYNITANRYGTERDVTFSGQSIISDPTGKTLYKSPSKADYVKVISADISLTRNKQITPRNNVFTDRRPDEYKDLV